MIFATLATVSTQAEPIVQAHNLPAASPAEALVGVTGAYPLATEAVAKPVIIAQKVLPVADTAADEPVDLLGEFNVTAQRRRTTERENTQTTYVVSRKDIEAAGAVTLPDALKLVPGLTLGSNYSGIPNFGNFYINGLDDERFIVLQDGRITADTRRNSSGNFLSQTSTMNIERIEVLTGGATLRYGADAVAGVINIITRTPEGPPKLRAAVNFGSYGFSQYQLDYSGSNGIDRSEKGYVGYEIGYERRSAINDYAYTVNQAPVSGAGVLFNGEFINGSVSFNQQAHNLYTFSDLFYGKLIFKPAKEHTISIYAQKQAVRNGDYRGFTNGNCGYLIPPNFYGNAEAYPRCYTAAGYNGGSYEREDFKSDQIAVNAIWDWNLSDLNTLEVQLDGYDAFINNASNDGQLFQSQRVAEAKSVTPPNFIVAILSIQAFSL